LIFQQSSSPRVNKVIDELATSAVVAQQTFLAAEAVLREFLKLEKRVLRDLGETRICV
jgi:hypothetical protein